MAVHTNEIVPPFDFSVALKHSLEDRFLICVDRVRRVLIDSGMWDYFGVPPVPEYGATDAELKALESVLDTPLPTEYRTFLHKWRYLGISDGTRIWGVSHAGISIGWPWVSDEHRASVKYLVFADYWMFADGDQLMFEVGDADGAVVAYLHEHGPLYEWFAPSFSLALWRIMHE